MSTNFSRRDLMGGALMTLPASAALSASAAFAAPAPKGEAEAGFKLGVASYSLRKMSRADAIQALKTLNVTNINVKDFHLKLDSTPAEIKQAKKEFDDAGINILGIGNVNFAKDDEGEMRRNFEYAKMLGAPLIVMAPTHQTVAKVEKFVKEYNIKAAIHNHGPEDKQYPAPADVLKDVKSMDTRVGLCIDIGHTTRTKTDVVQSIREAGNRVHDLHGKDLRDLMGKDSQCPVGDGAMPIPAIFRQLEKMGYKGGFMLEYEIDTDNPVPGMQKSFAYMRGVLAGMKA